MGGSGASLVSLVVGVMASIMVTVSTLSREQEQDRMSHMEMSSFTCGDSTQAKEFNFVSPGYPVSIGLDNLTCGLTVGHGCSDSRPNSLSEPDQSICQLRLDFDELTVQPPLLGNCVFDMFYVSANGKYPLICGENTGHHVYLNVEGRASTDLTFILSNLQERLYSCPDTFNVLDLESGSQESIMRDSVAMRGDTPVVNINGGGGPGANMTMLKFPTRRAWKVRVTQIPCGCGKHQVSQT